VADLANKLLTFYDNNITASRSIAWLLLEHITGKTRESLLIERDFVLSSTQNQLLDILLIDLLEKHKPLAYILGTVEFAGLDLLIEPPILIPRPETEEWCLDLIEHIKPLVSQANYQGSSQRFTIVDVCTGSGCIALALAHAFDQAEVYALDINPQALKLAQKNAQKLGIKNIKFLESDLLSALSTCFKADLITANPPYINPQDFAALEPTVRKWEDYQALCAEGKGLALIEKLVNTAPQFLTTRYGCGEFWCEIGYNQAQEVEELFKKAGFGQIIIKKDLAGMPRVACGIAISAK